MNCNCIDETNERLVKHALAHGVVNPTLSENFLGINLITGDPVISMRYTLRGDNRPYNTSKGKPASIVASYCPFCGKSVKKEAA